MSEEKNALHFVGEHFPKISNIQFARERVTK